jgi:glycosyltransferase involved in cell wall biosynthesis
MTNSQSVSIVIPVLNGAKTIHDMLTALFSQAGAPQDKEIIVVDNGSTDGSQDIVKNFDITFLVETKPGVSAARNRGLAYASGDIYINIDADTLPTRYWLRELVSPFSDPEVILVGGKVLSFKPETAAERYIENSGLYAPENSVTNPDLPFVAGMNLAVRRKAALAVGGWDEDLLRSDDIDFSYRLTQKFSTRITYQPSALIFHRNRRTDDGLKKQALGYGYGAAIMYQRYPEQLKWGMAQSIKLASLLAHRTIMPEVRKIGHRLGRVSDEELEFAKYHRMWTLSFWRGFLKTYYSKSDKRAAL